MDALNPLEKDDNASVLLHEDSEESLHSATPIESEKLHVNSDCAKQSSQCRFQTPLSVQVPSFDDTLYKLNNLMSKAERADTGFVSPDSAPAKSPAAEASPAGAAASPQGWKLGLE
jgi:hypothetical protein